MSPEEGIRPAGPAAQEAAVRYTSCPMVQAIICLRAVSYTHLIYKYQSGDCIMREVLASYCSRPVEPLSLIHI